MSNTLYSDQHIKRMEAALRFVQYGCIKGSIKSKGILQMNDKAPSYPTYSLYEYVTAALENREPKDQQ